MSEILLSKASIICSANTRESERESLKSTQDSRESALESKRESRKSHDSLLLAFQNNTRFLRESSAFLERKIFVGKCENLAPLPKNTPFVFQTRTNEILFNALNGLDSLIQKLISTLGREKIAVVIGTTTTGIGENYLAIAQNKAHLGALDLAQKDAFLRQIGYTNAKNALCNQSEFVRAFYALKSLAFGVSSACTSGGKAIIEGARLLKAKLCDAVICGGSDSLNRLTIAGFNALEILSSAQSAPFSANRDGINIGEGAGIFVLIRSDLLHKYPQFADDFRLKILAHKSNNDAFHITNPSPDFSAQREVLEACICANPNIDYVNLHGTGTPANDAMEANLLASMLPNVACSTIKPFIGHTLGAAGAIELGICANLILDSLQNGESPLPPHIISDYDANLPRIALVKQGAKKRVKTALSLSFAFGGDNSAILIGVRDD